MLSVLCDSFQLRNLSMYLVDAAAAEGKTLEFCALQLRRKWLPHMSRRAPVAAEIARGTNRLTAADTRLCVAAAGSSYAGKIGTRECCKWLRHT